MASERDAIICVIGAWTSNQLTSYLSKKNMVWKERVVGEKVDLENVLPRPQQSCSLGRAESMIHQDQWNFEHPGHFQGLGFQVRYKEKELADRYKGLRPFGGTSLAGYPSP